MTPFTLFTFEGIDGCGKSTVMQTVADMLNETEHSNDFTTTAEKYHPIVNNGLFNYGDESNRPCETSIIHYWWLSRIIILDQLKTSPSRGLFLDRYYDSTFVYQNLPSKPLSVLQHNFDPIYFAVPNITFYFKVSPEIALSRLVKDGNPNDIFEDKKLETLKEKSDLYDQLYTLKPYEPICGKRNVCLIDADADLDTVIGTVAGVVFKYIDFGGAL